MSLSTPAKAPRTGREGLRHLLGTFDVDMFLNEYLGENMLHLTEDRGRWGELFSWDDLNRLLNRDAAAPPPYLRLVRRGQVVKSSSYSHERGGLTTIDPARCQRLMAEGATLIVQLPEGLSPALDTLMASLKRDLNAPAYADIVVTSASVPGLKMHWDPYECFNIQLAGCKEWQVVRPGRPYPLRETKYFPARSDLVEPRAPTGPPTWTGLMHPGDLIYLPRGWWHGVTPQTVPSMHLSIAVDIPTISDFIGWCAQSLKAKEAARRPLPCWNADRMSAMADRARELAAATIDAGTLEAFLADATDQRRPTAPFALPSAGLAKASAVSLTGTTRVQLRQPPLQYRIQDGLLRVEVGADTLEFTERVTPAVRRLNDRESCTLVELMEACDPLLVKAFVLSLIAGGLANIVEET
jgi:hypothetical protein